MRVFAILIKPKRVMVLSKNNPLQIRVPKHDQWETKQPKHGRGVVPTCPFRICTSSPSGAGKTVWIVDMLTRIYAGCFERIYIFSPSMNIDSIWDSMKDYVYKTMGVPEDEQCFSLSGTRIR